MKIFTRLNRVQKTQRLLAIIASLALVTVSFAYLREAEDNVSKLVQQQSFNIMTNMTQQLGLALAPLLQEKKVEQLQWLTDTWVKDPQLHSISIFQNNGKLLVHSVNYQGADTVNEQQLITIEQASQLIVSPINWQTNDIGYIRCYFAKDAFSEALMIPLRDAKDQQILLFAFIFITGFLLSQVVSVKRAKYQVYKNTQK
ncbi:AhpA/YtjB family protein [Paraferrimonas sp. SM1919]|uniref:AhpA/YtjB family protein n=1 Tax=Paraferrimonas sp. SM1919 TaxID=2662263 RepID=UPI0013D5B6DD|nr:AhpA/YtjB family protein [Paraferrimonas sp. SM1919]